MPTTRPASEPKLAFIIMQLLLLKFKILVLREPLLEAILNS